MARTPLGLTLQGAMNADPANLNAGFAPGPATQPQPHGFFREGGMGRTLAGTIGDFLLQQAHVQPVYAPAMRQQQSDQREEAQWSRRREADRADKQWEWANKPENNPAPSEFERMLEASGVQRGTPQWAETMGKRVQNLLNPMMPVATTDADGNPAYTYLPRNGGPVAPGGPPAAAIEHLKANPALKDAFEQKYGPGSASAYLTQGGPMPKASGGFR